MAEYSPREKRILGFPKRLWPGGTTRGWVEGPHLYRHGGRYYLVCAEGGTGYHHCASVARAGSLWGPYESDPQNPVLTSSPVEEIDDPTVVEPSGSSFATAFIAAFSMRAIIAGVASTGMSPEPTASAVCAWST